MVRSLLIRGMLVGLLAGLLMFGFGRVFGEPAVQGAIDIETAMEAAHGHADAEPELVSRPMQAGLGLFTGVVVYAAAFGGLFALVFVVADGRLGRLGPRGVSAVLAGLGFVVVYLVPNLKYPANPPSIGQPDTIGERTGLYFAMILVSVVAAVVATVLRERLARYGGWNATLAAAALYLVAVVAAAALLPGIDEVPAEFPAALLWNFRVAALGLQAVLWTTLGLGFGILAERLRAPMPRHLSQGLRST